MSIRSLRYVTFSSQFLKINNPELDLQYISQKWNSPITEMSGMLAYIKLNKTRPLPRCVSPTEY